MITLLFAALFCFVFGLIVKIGLRHCNKNTNAASDYEKATRWQQQILKMPIQEGAIEQQKWRSYVNTLHSRKNNIRSI